MAISIKDVAAKAGVAVSTVSLALRNSMRLKQETRDHVRRVADELGYQRNPVFAALGASNKRRSDSSRGMPLAWVFQCASQERTGPWKPVFDAAAVRAKALGFQLTPYHLDEFRSAAQAKRVLYARGVVGVVIEYFENPDTVLAVDWSPFSVVACGAFSQPLPFDMVRDTNFLTGRAAYRAVWDRGYRRIGIAALHHEPAFFDDWGRIGGALASEVELRGHLGDVPPLTCSIRDHNHVVDWLRRHQPEAVLGFPPYLYDDLIAEGFQVPRDFGFASMALFPEQVGHIAGTIHNYAGLGVAVIDSLDANIRMGIRGRVALPRNQIIQATWHNGVTLPPKAGC
jgi:LacI family transcriptional regulator